MIDFAHLEQYRENNRIEAKKARGGLPHSIWETYSAFANTLGGVILLGVVEDDNKQLEAVGVPDPDQLVKEFWNIVNNINKVSVNILSTSDVSVESVDGKSIVVINVPRAQRADRPVYLLDNPLRESYRRNGEGDYRCTQEEVRAMLRDAAMRTQDMIVLENMDIEALNRESLHSYRTRMQACRPGHVWEGNSDQEFLYKIGAVGRDRQGTLHPTGADLLMFGNEYEIVKEFPNYFLDYREKMDPQVRWTDRFVSSSGDWSGNLYDFYFRVYNRLALDIRTPFQMKNGSRVDDTPIHEALREALANCLINADYYGRQGIVIEKRPESFSFSNPGGFRVDVEAAISGGISDPRNAVLIKMFNLINIGERAGSGIPNIFRIWNKEGWPAPVIRESFDPERITVSLFIGIDSEKSENPLDNTEDNPDKFGENPDKQAKVTINKIPGKSAVQKAAIVEYLTENPKGKSAQIAKLLGVSADRARQLLLQMVEDGLVETEGANRNRTYKLKD